LHNAQRCRARVNGAKYVALFHQNFFLNFTACFRLHLLHRAPYFGTFLPIVVAVKSIKYYLRKSCSALALKMWMKLTLMSRKWKFIWQTLKNNLNIVFSRFNQIKLGLDSHSKMPQT
jgi:hypothetical protein